MSRGVLDGLKDEQTRYELAVTAQFRKDYKPDTRERAAHSNGYKKDLIVRRLPFYQVFCSSG